MQSARIEELVGQLTLDEKISLLAGKNFWETVDIPRLNIPSIFMTDGPHGLRKALSSEITDLAESVPATCFPTASGLASTWNTDLIRRVGEALAEECKANDVQVLLGPGINIKRSPLGGRNFEYFSEDPTLTSSMAISYIRGVQSRGVGTSLKHFALNSQETERFTSSSDPDERAYHEVYLAAFEQTVTTAQPWSLMVAYNQIHGVPATENVELLTTILRDTWGYKGIALSDWGAVSHRTAALAAGLQLQMPGPGRHEAEQLKQAVDNQSLDLNIIDTAVRIILEGTFAIHEQRDPHASYDQAVHHALAREAAGEAIVLLKNTHAVLPLTLDTHRTIAVIGEFAKHPRYQGAGSSQVNPTKLDAFYDILTETYGSHATIHYAAGYHSDGTTTSALVARAVEVAKTADVVIVLAGLPSSAESEGFDRTSIDMPQGHNQLIDALAQQHAPVVVALMNGSIVAMPWVQRVDAVLECWLGGQAGSAALVDVITGATNPSGKLSETIPARIEDTPAYPFFPSRSGSARYEEGIFVGYKWYDKRAIAPLFPFGFGLSYTTFAFSDLSLSTDALSDEETLELSFTVTNTGHRAGKTVAQVYVSDQTDTVLMPVRQLKAFSKLHLDPGTSQRVTLALTPRDFAFYDTEIHDWRVPAGRFTISVGDSSTNLPLSTALMIHNAHTYIPIISEKTPLRMLRDHPRGATFYGMIADSIPPALRAFVDETPIGKLAMLAGDRLSPSLVEKIIHHANTPGSMDPVAIPAKIAKFAHWYHEHTHKKSKRTNHRSK